MYTTAFYSLGVLRLCQGSSLAMERAQNFDRLQARNVLSAAAFDVALGDYISDAVLSKPLSRFVFLADTTPRYRRQVTTGAHIKNRACLANICSVAIKMPEQGFPLTIRQHPRHDTVPDKAQVARWH